jgi:hypothetical protein
MRHIVRLDLRQDFIARVDATIGLDAWRTEFEPLFREVISLNPYMFPMVDGIYIAKLNNGYTIFYLILDDGQIRPCGISGAG